MVRKFVEDQSTVLAFAIAFWAFFAVFPLLLVFVTLLGYFLPPNLQGGQIQPVEACDSTSSVNSSEGFFQFNILRGRSLISQATMAK